MSTNPYLKRAERQTKTAHGNKSEVRVGKSLGARMQPGSGNMAGAKSDARLRAKYKFRIECKSTVNKTMALEAAWLTKISYEASATGEIPALTVSFVDPQGKLRLERDSEWVAIPMWAFQQLIEE